ncbi:MAG: di-heme oxidoredictase family protein [Muribaculaceae bacterium]
MNIFKMSVTAAAALSALALASCSDDEKITNTDTPDTPERPDWYYAGGKLGTTELATSNVFEQPTAAVENQGLYQSFKNGEAIFEKPFMTNTDGVRGGLGPVYIRTSCTHCHPNYSHGERVAEGSYDTRDPGNGTLLVVYNPATEGYVPWLAGMPQLYAVAPFKAPVDGSKVRVSYREATDTWGNRFDDGETYSLQYPVVDMPSDAIYVVNQGYQLPTGYEVKLESTIGIPGTGLLDAIDEKDLLAQYQKEEADGFLPNGLNSAFYAGGAWVSPYKNTVQGDGTPYARRFTYALSRGPLQDAAGANAIWNITNVTRSDRRYHYLDAAGTYAEYSAKDPDVQAGFDDYLAKVDPSRKHPEWWTGPIEDRIKNYLLSKDLDPEMTDDEYTDLMVWHRGLAVPAVRDIDDPDVIRGRELFAQIGCDYCHRPSWTTGPDNIADPAKFFRGDELPRYPYQTIWPYTDMVQHKLMMASDIRGGWCRTTPLWGRGLHQKVTGSPTADRLHDCRARTTLEAIMWHGYSPQSDAYHTVVKFRALPKADRDAIIRFVDAI